MFSRFLRPFLCLLLAPITPVPAHGQPESAMQERVLTRQEYAAIIEDYRPRILRTMSEQDIPGLAVALVSSDTVLWSEGFGFTDDDHGSPVTPTTMFSIQSMSKTVTATLVMIAAQEGLVDLNAPITAYLPGFTVNSDFEEHPERKITLKHLLSHTAGLAHEAPVGSNAGRYDAPFEDHIRSISATWLKFPVGRRYEYSNLGIDLAGYILQVRSGIRFEEFARTRLLDPLGMTRSSFDHHIQRTYASRAVGHSRSLPRYPLEIPMIPAGSFYTNAEELARFVQFHLRRGSIGDSVLLESAWFDTMYAVPWMAEGQTDGYALGITSTSLFGSCCLSHGGGGFGFSTQMRWYPEFDLGVLVLTNLAEAPSRSLAMGIIDRVVAERIPGRAAVTRLRPEQLGPIPVPEPAVRQILGTYFHSEGGMIEVCQKDGVVGVVQGGTFFPLTFLQKHEAFTEENGSIRSIFRFVLDEQGKPVSALDYYGWPLSYAFDHGAGDGPGPDRPEWQRYPGRYRLLYGGVPVGMISVEHQQGYLSSSGLRFREVEPGVFMNGGGEVLDLRDGHLSVGNVPIEKIRVPLVTLLLVGAVVLVFVWVIAGWPLASLVRRRRDLRRHGHAWKTRPLPALLAWLVSLLSLGLLIVIGIHPYLIGYGFPWNPRLPFETKTMLLAPLAVVLLALLFMITSIRIWASPSAPMTVRMNYAIVGGAALTMSLVLFVWKLVILPL